jgi:hypothetical protein
MKPITANRNIRPERSPCAGGGLAPIHPAADFFGAYGVWQRPRPFTFSPAHIIRKFPSALRAPGGLRNNRSKQLHRNLKTTAGRWLAPPRTSASRRRPRGWQKLFHRLESVGLKIPGNAGCLDRKQAE